MGVMQSINPASGELLREFEEISPAELQNRLARADAAFRSYRRTSFGQRAQWLLRAAQILEQEKMELGTLMTSEMGKTLASAVAEAEKCAWACRHYAEHGARFLAREAVPDAPGTSFIEYQPIGPVLAIMPWNFPFFQVFRFAAPALMAGNVALLKHASNVPQCALALEEIIRRAGFPADVFQTLLIGSGRVADVIADPRVKAATLTGSEPAGAAVASHAGQHIKKTVLELGGSDPFIIMPSADLAAAVQTAVTARSINNGQSCIAAKRFIVHADIYDAFLQKFVAAMAAQVIGDPMNSGTHVGPLATAKLRDDLDRQVKDSVAQGARVLLGGHALEGAGWYYAATVLADIPRSAAAWREELFGPVATVYRAADIEEAITIANDNRYGLGSAAWTRDADEQERFIADIEAGLVFINGMVASDPRLPFGGVKHSGYGRELGVFGIREFVNIKTVVVQNRAAPPQGAPSE